MRGGYRGRELLLPHFELRGPLRGLALRASSISESCLPGSDRIVHGSSMAHDEHWGANAYLVAAEALELLDPQIKPHRRALDFSDITGLTAYFGASKLRGATRRRHVKSRASAGIIGVDRRPIARIRAPRRQLTPRIGPISVRIEEQLGCDNIPTALNYDAASLERLRDCAHRAYIYFDHVGGALDPLVMCSGSGPPV